MPDGDGEEASRNSLSLTADAVEEDAVEEDAASEEGTASDNAAPPANKSYGTDAEVEELLKYIKRSRGFDYTGYKRASLRRRLDKRLGEVGADSYNDYTDFLEVHPEEFVLLLNGVLINVTAFFRDPDFWEYLSAQIIPQLLAGKAEDEPVRLWSAGCASGQEPYSLAMLLAEALGLEAFKARVKIYATDIDEEALAHARSGSYSAREVAGVPPFLLEKYFDREGDRHVFSRELRRCLIFGRNDLLQDAPISRIDLLSCRNTVMYFHSEVQAVILARFHFAIRDGGFLFFGKAEMLFAHSGLFQPLDLRRRVFVKMSRPTSLREPLLLIADAGVEAALPPGGSLGLWEAAFQTSPTAQLVLDLNGRLTMVNEGARTLFHLSAQDIGRPLQDLEISYRPVELRSRIETAQAQGKAVAIQDVPLVVGVTQPIYLEALIVPLQENGAPLGVSISFTNVTRYRQLLDELQDANRDMETVQTELQAANEEMETTNEELQSTVEELETTNEELQSMVEELETASEEALSVNEELQAVNTELSLRSGELNQANAYLESILTSLNHGVAVLNSQMRVQTWNAQSQEMWGLRPEEVRGALFGDLDIGLPAPALLPLIRDCFSGGAALREVTLEARNRRGQLFACRVIVTPLRGAARSIQGVMLLMEQQSGETAG